MKTDQGDRSLFLEQRLAVVIEVLEIFRVTQIESKC